jgi:hypothetical protein
MSRKYLYKGKDLTTLIHTKIEHVVSLIAETEKLSFEEAYLLFISSKAFENLTNPLTLLWSESAEFILDDFYRS